MVPPPPSMPKNLFPVSLKKLFSASAPPTSKV
jgi:hypothetical protein